MSATYLVPSAMIRKAATVADHTPEEFWLHPGEIKSTDTVVAYSCRRAVWRITGDIVLLLTSRSVWKTEIFFR